MIYHYGMKMKKWILVIIIFSILFCSICFEVFNIHNIKTTIKNIQQNQLYCITVKDNDNDNEIVILNSDSNFNEIYEKIFSILMSETEVLEQSFMRGDAQDVKTIIFQTIKDEIIEIRLAYSYTKELCRITVFSQSEESIYKIINLPKSIFDDLTQ